MTFSLYIHIPFCEVKCGYCDFFSVPRGFEDFDLQTQYVNELIREIKNRSEETRKIDTLFFGGGTPSLLDPKLLEKIFQALRSHFSWDDKTEITLETNPKTVSLEKLKSFKSLGINRLSIGVQSFQDSFLKALGRIHSGQEAKQTVKDAREAGFKNISMDLIFALPGQTFPDWQQDLEEAIRLETPHLSAYHLTIEPETPFEKMYGSQKIPPTPPLLKGGMAGDSPFVLQKTRWIRLWRKKGGRGDLPSEEEGVDCLTWTRKRLAQAGLEAYEVSNFARPGFECRHNQNYWQYGDYLGFGAGAASFIKCRGESCIRPRAITRIAPTEFGRRRTNVRDLKKYLAGEWVGFSEEIDLEMAMGEFCMLGLRTREGISEETFRQFFQKDFLEVFGPTLKKLQQKGWLQKQDHQWRVSKTGFLFLDDVVVSFFP